MVNSSHVIYSYALKKYRNSEELPPTDTVLRSSARCVGRSVIGEDVYEKGEQIGTIRRKYIQAAVVLPLSSGPP